VDPVPGGEQGLHPRAALGLDTDDHLIRVRIGPGVGGEQGVEPVDSGDALLEAGGAQPPAGLVLDLDVVMVLGPVISHEQHVHSPVVDSDYLRQQRGSPSNLMNQCSRQVAGTTSHQRLTLPTTGGGTVCQQDYPTVSRTHECSPTSSYQGPKSAVGSPR
jgi:hypothetical protein